MSGALTILMSGQSALYASVSPVSLIGYAFAPGTVTTSSSVIVTAYGGKAPYTYLWTYVSGDADITPNVSTSASTRFSAYLAGASSTYTAVWKCVVTDANADVVDSPNVTINLLSSNV